jgi:hypothetical protein
MLWIALAAQLSAPVPTNLPNWFSYDDLPPYLIEREPGHWLVGVRVTVGPDGAVQDCHVESTSGTERLDEFTCKRIEQRAGFQPGRSSDGAAVLGVYRAAIPWAVVDSPFDSTLVSIPDVDVSVASLPAGLKSPALVRVMFAVDPDGRMHGCTAEPGEHVSNHPDLVPVACDQLTQIYKPVPATDASGKAVPSVQNATVRFSVQSHASR